MPPPGTSVPVRPTITVHAGKAASQEVTEECDVLQAVSLTNSDDQQIRIFVQDNAASPKLKEALQQAIGLRTKVVATQRELQQQQKLLGDITQDQVRLRANLKEMPQTPLTAPPFGVASSQTTLYRAWPLLTSPDGDTTS